MFSAGRVVGWVAGPLANKESVDSQSRGQVSKVAKRQRRSQELGEADLRVSWASATTQLWLSEL